MPDATSDPAPAPMLPTPTLPGPPVDHEHRDVAGGWLRPTVFGAMDGLVSNFALIAGVAGASSHSSAVTLAGLAGLVGGAFSMATGEYVSVRSQNESTLAEVAIERDELRVNAQAELAELVQVYVDRGVDRDLAQRVAEQLSRDPEQALQIHAQEELGVDPAKLPSPVVAAGSSLFAFAAGAFVPLLPYAAGARTLWISAVLAAVALFAAGVGAARWTSRNALYSGLRQLVLGVVAAAVTFGVGSLFHAAGG